MQPFLTWKGTNTTRDPLRKAHEAAAIEVRPTHAAVRVSPAPHSTSLTN